MTAPIDELAIQTIDHLATRLEQAGLLPPDATYEEFECIIEQLVRFRENNRE